jgi:hypothetical protein
VIAFHSCAPAVAVSISRPQRAQISMASMPESNPPRTRHERRYMAMEPAGIGQSQRLLEPDPPDRRPVPVPFRHGTSRSSYVFSHDFPRPGWNRGSFRSPSCTSLTCGRPWPATCGARVPAASRPLPTWATWSPTGQACHSDAGAHGRGLPEPTGAGRSEISNAVCLRCTGSGHRHRWVMRDTTRVFLVSGAPVCLTGQDTGLVTVSCPPKRLPRPVPSR